MNEEQRNWQLFQKHMRLIDEEEKSRPDPFFQRAIGAAVGGILGPKTFIFLISLLPPVPYEDTLPNLYDLVTGVLISLIIPVGIGGLIGAVLSPMIVMSIKRWWARI